MSPLRFEGFRADIKRWVPIGEVKPTDLAGSFANIARDGSREFIVFECNPDDASSTIYRVKPTVEVNIAQFRIVDSDRTQWETVVTLKKDESYDLFIKTDNSPQRRHIRFKHV